MVEESARRWVLARRLEPEVEAEEMAKLAASGLREELGPSSQLPCPETWLQRRQVMIVADERRAAHARIVNDASSLLARNWRSSAWATKRRAARRIPLSEDRADDYRGFS